MTIDKPSWLLRFAAHLHRLQPSLEGHIAAQVAMASYAANGDRPPEQAAELYAAEDPPGDASTRDA